MKQLENILAVEQRQLSEILEEDREEFENGLEFASGASDVKRLENAKTVGSKSNQLSSMQSAKSNESKMKGIGSGLTTIN